MVLLVFAVRPTISTILNLQKNIADDKKVLASLEEKANNLTLAKQNLENLNPETKNKIEKLLPAKTNVTSLISSLKESSGNTASISALQIQPVNLINENTDTTKAKMNVGEINFSYNIQGSFSQLLVILQNLNRSSRLIKIDNIVLSRQANVSTILSVNGKAYYLK